MFREPLDDNAALNILGDDYNAGHSYFLMSDRDQFVVYDVDENGKLFNEIRLEETPYETPEDESLEELFGVSLEEHTTTTKNYKKVIILQRIAYILFFIGIIVVVRLLLR